MDITAINGALSAAKTAFDLLGIVAKSRDEAKIQDALVALNERIFEIRNAAFDLQAKLSAKEAECDAIRERERQTKARLAELEGHRSQRSQYNLHELSRGVFVLAPNETHQQRDPVHYLCQPCMDNVAKQVVLQRAQNGEAVHLVCNECKAAYLTGERQEHQPFVAPQVYSPRGNW